MSRWYRWHEEPLPSTEVVEKWEHDDIVKFLSEKKYFCLNDDDIKIIKNKNFNGPIFLMLTEDKLEKWGISEGPVIAIADFVKTLNTYVVMKEVHCTASYNRKIAKFQWTITREMVSLAGLKKKLREYFTFPDGTEEEHIVISRVLDVFPPTKRKISTSRMEKPKPGMNEVLKNSDQIKSDSQVESVERKSIHLSTDEDLMSIVWTASHKIDLTIIVDTSQQPFSSYTFSKMKDLFGLKADSYDQLPQFKGGILMTPEDIRNDAIKEILKLHKESPPVNSANEATRCEFISRIIYGVGSIYNGNVKIYPQYEVSGSHGKGPIDWVIKVGDAIISVTEAKKENINQGVAQSTVQAHASLQRNSKKRNHHEADLYEDVIYCIVSTGEAREIDLKSIKQRNCDGNGNGIDNNGDGKVEVFLCSPTPKPLPINDPSLTRDDLVGPVENLFGQINWVFDQQIESQKRQRTQ
ncbi:6514_t:CDS:2 [Gigaspora margarita]|uniref:6514_t:CDS:1 n=1 Tax=Gigaspora margarita TaxID=4874 RepID=A0ABN7WG86_GIGMA|nr:6514_t:CDS:2 [Gigaspora margarita]